MKDDLLPANMKAKTLPWFTFAFAWIFKENKIFDAYI